MVRRRWLLIIAVSMVQLACSKLPLCHDPGSAFSQQCYYELKVLDGPDSNGMVTAQTYEEAVRANAVRGWRKEGWIWPFSPDFDYKKEYPYPRYRFQVKGGHVRKDTAYGFCSEPNQYWLNYARDIAEPYQLPEPDKDLCSK
jgi:hypothetical protein